MALRPPTATIRTQVALPLRFADGCATDARVFSFDGLVDGGEHLAFALGEWTDVPLTIAVAWIFASVFERPFLRQRSRVPSQELQLPAT